MRVSLLIPPVRNESIAQDNCFTSPLSYISPLYRAHGAVFEACSNNRINVAHSRDPSPMARYSVNPPKEANMAHPNA
jgi:hypothetical protein